MPVLIFSLSHPLVYGNGPGEGQGYLCGAFYPKELPLHSKGMEVLVRYLGPADEEKANHHYKNIEELFLVLKGGMPIFVQLPGEEGEDIILEENEFILAKPGTITRIKQGSSFGTVLVVVKSPSIPGDKVNDN